MCVTFSEPHAATIEELPDGHYLVRVHRKTPAGGAAYVPERNALVERVTQSAPSCISVMGGSPCGIHLTWNLTFTDLAEATLFYLQEH